MENYKMIDYDHIQGDHPCNGNLSDVEGGFEAHWTFEGREGTMTEMRPLTHEGFALLWDGIAASISGGGVFGRCLVTDPTRLIDPDLHHVITTTQVQDGWVRHWTFMVPASEADPAFVAWLDALMVPGGARRGTCMPERAGTGVAGQANAAAQRDRISA